MSSMTISDVKAAARLESKPGRFNLRSTEDGSLLGVIQWGEDRKAWAAAVIVPREGEQDDFEVLPGAYVDPWNAAGAILTARREA
jgi:hypothetical protein